MWLYKDKAHGFGGQGLILSSLLNDGDVLENVDPLIDYFCQGNSAPLHPLTLDSELEYGFIILVET